MLLEGYKVVIVDNLENSCEEAVHRVRELAGKNQGRNLIFKQVDLRDKDALEEIFDTFRFDAVIHFAGLKAVGESVLMPLLYYNNNIIGTLNLLNAMTRHGCKELIIEDMLRDVYTADPTWRIVLLRYFNPVGAHPSGHIGEDPRGIPNNLMPFVQQVAVGRRTELTVFGNDYNTRDGTGVRDYIHVMDLASGHSQALKKLFNTPDLGCAVYNLGTGRGTSVLEMVAAFEKASGKKIPLRFTHRRQGDCSEVYAATEKAEKELGWRAKFGIEEMCRDQWNWASKNPYGYCPSSAESNGSMKGPCNGTTVDHAVYYGKAILT
ncbi:hypothetical protein BDL97_06G122000 [Sphagnum fallax]|nr:hypothetical protein BDL97_06G122000 [Sphagnum fallax]